MKKHKIAIIGLGKLGSAITQEAIRSDIFSDIYIVNRSKDTLESSFLSFSVFASIIGSKCKIHKIDNIIDDRVDLVVIAIKEKYDPRVLLKTEILPREIQPDVRNIGIRKDIPLLYNVSSLLKSYTGNIVILSNPVDIFTMILQKILPHAKIFGLGLSLDTARFIYSARCNGIKCSSSDCYLGGTHTRDLIILKSISNPKCAINRMNKNELKNIIYESSKIGPRIVAGLGYTLHDCVAVFSKDINWFLSEKKDTKYLCAAIYHNDAVTGYPLVKTSDKKIVRYEFLTDHEEELLTLSALKIKSMYIALQKENLI